MGAVQADVFEVLSLDFRVGSYGWFAQARGFGLCCHSCFSIIKRMKISEYQVNPDLRTLNGPRFLDCRNCIKMHEEKFLERPPVFCLNSLVSQI